MNEKNDTLWNMPSRKENDIKWNKSLGRENNTLWNMPSEWGNYIKWSIPPRLENDTLWNMSSNREKNDLYLVVRNDKDYDL